MILLHNYEKHVFQELYTLLGTFVHCRKFFLTRSQLFVILRTVIAHPDIEIRYYRIEYQDEEMIEDAIATTIHKE